MSSFLEYLRLAVLWCDIMLILQAVFIWRLGQEFVKQLLCDNGLVCPLVKGIEVPLPRHLICGQDFIAKISRKLLVEDNASVYGFDNAEAICCQILHGGTQNISRRPGIPTKTALGQTC